MKVYVVQYQWVNKKSQESMYISGDHWIEPEKAFQNKEDALSCAKAMRDKEAERNPNLEKFEENANDEMMYGVWQMANGYYLSHCWYVEELEVV